MKCQHCGSETTSHRRVCGEMRYLERTDAALDRCTSFPYVLGLIRAIAAGKRHKRN